MVLEIIQVQVPRGFPLLASNLLHLQPGELLWNTLLIDCSSHRGAHFIHSHICSISNGSRDNSTFTSATITWVPAGFHYSPVITSATITWDPGELQWNTLLIDCSSHRGAHFIHSHICSISNGSQIIQVQVPRGFPLLARFITSATITWDSGELLWNTLLIDCSSHRGAHIYDIFATIWFSR